MDPDPRNEKACDESIDRRFSLEDPADQGAVRAEIRRLLAGADVSDERIDDVLVVLSELWSNAVEHSAAAEVTTEVSLHPGGVVATVSYLATPSTADDLPAAAMPPAEATRGRGLAIVDALADSYRHEMRGEKLSTTCIFRAS